MKTSDQEVADRIFHEFRKKKLLSEDGIKKIGPSLPNGNMRAEDWRFLFETDRLEKEADNASKSK